MSSRRRVVAGVFGLSLVLGACGSNVTTTSTSSTAAAGAGSTTSAVASTGTTPGGTTVGTAPDPSGTVTVKIVDTPFGKALGRGDGKVLYAWDAEIGSDAQCTSAACVEKWPPLLAGPALSTEVLPATAKITVLSRPDGTEQLAVNGRRLYAMKLDKPGEANCQGVEGWYILNPDGTKNDNETPQK